MWFAITLLIMSLQHCRCLSLAGMMVVVKLEGSPQLCKTDEVGELCLSSGCCGTGYWGLPGVSSSVFKVDRICLCSLVLPWIIHVLFICCMHCYIVQQHCQNGFDQPEVATFVILVPVASSSTPLTLGFLCYSVDLQICLYGHDGIEV